MTHANPGVSEWPGAARLRVSLWRLRSPRESRSAATARPTKRHSSFRVGLWGDFPYSDVQAQTGVPNLIADMNNSDISFSIHDGDLKAGSGTAGSATPTTCSDALYTSAGFQVADQLRVWVMSIARTGPSGGVSRYCGYLLVRRASARSRSSPVSSMRAFPRRRGAPEALPVLVVVVNEDGDVWTGAGVFDPA